MNAGNIFEAFFLAKEKIVKEPDIFSDPEYMKILQSVKKYFDSFVWVSNPMDRLIYLYAGKGYNNNAVADFIGVNVNTYRSRVSRVSTKLSGFCRKFEYDWKRDLPDIARLIDMKYPEGCEIILTYREWFEAGVICDKKIFAKTLLKEKLRSRRLAIMLIDFMKDESVRLSKINSTKNPDTRLLFDDLPSIADDVKQTFYLIIDIDETIRSERDIVDYCIYGGWINKEFIEVLGKEEVLPLFEDLIPDILRREMILCG